MKKYDYVNTQREDVKEIPEKWVWLIRFVMKAYTRLNVFVFKHSRGKLMKYFMDGYPICLVGMTGKKTGKRREIPLLHLPYGDNKLLVASQGGMNKHPVWYYNVRDNPAIDIMVGGIKKHYIAKPVPSANKADLWPHLLDLYPDFDEYQARTDRDIPVFICEPVE